MRISLHVKLAITHLTVAGLVLLSTLFYFRTLLNRELQESVQRELERDLVAIGQNLADTAPDELEVVVRLVRDVVPHRVAVFDPTGRLFGTPPQPGTPLPASTVESNVVESGRRESSGNDASDEVITAAVALLPPELRDALETGTGRAVRPDDDGVRRIFAAMRFPQEGPARGVVRLAMEASVVDTEENGRFPFLNRAGAAALSFAVFLSLGAAWVASRPLRRIASAARAFAAGDFGHPVGIDSRDELGEAARALEQLASQLRNRLLASGADRAALHALLNDLPVGVIIYDGRGTPLAMNGQVRAQCGFSPGDELDRAEQLLELGSQAPVVQRVLETGTSETAPLQLPWPPHSSLMAKWIPLYAPDGSRQPALVILDGDEGARAQDGSGEQIETLSSLLLEAAQQSELDSSLGARLAVSAVNMGVQRQVPAPDPERIVTLDSVDMVREALWRTGPIAREAEVMLELPTDAPTGVLADCDDRLVCATAWFLKEIIHASPGGGRLRLRLRRTEHSLQLIARTPRSDIHLEPAARLLLPLGGDADTSRDGGKTESKLDLPLA